MPETSPDIKVEYGKWLADFLTASEPPLAAVAGLLYRKFAPGLWQFFITPAALESYIKTGADKIEGLLNHESITLTPHPGIVADVIRQLVVSVPGFIGWIENELDPIILSELKSLGAV